MRKSNKFLIAFKVFVLLIILGCKQESKTMQQDSKFECNFNSDCVAICDTCLTMKQASLVECGPNTFTYNCACINNSCLVQT